MRHVRGFYGNKKEAGTTSLVMAPGQGKEREDVPGTYTVNFVNTVKYTESRGILRRTQLTPFEEKPHHH